MGMQRTALCARKIMAFLKLRIGSKVSPIYRCAAADAQPVGQLGNLVGIPFLMVTSRLRFGNARCARLVVPKPVVPAWFDGSWCSLPVMPGVIVCGAWF
jgi:hypothetical protein